MTFNSMNTNGCSDTDLYFENITGSPIFYLDTYGNEVVVTIEATNLFMIGSHPFRVNEIAKLDQNILHITNVNVQVEDFSSSPYCTPEFPTAAEIED